jgi:hypothetical protein
MGSLLGKTLGSLIYKAFAPNGALSYILKAVPKQNQPCSIKKEWLPFNLPIIKKNI